MPEDSRVKDRIRGCLFGGAAGDALGYPVEFLSDDDIRVQYGDKGITRYSLDPKSHKALISDDTQMTLFTANGLLFGNTRGSLRGIGAALSYYVAFAYRDWFWTQENVFGEKPEHPVSWLLDVPELYSRRAPGMTCLSALKERMKVLGSEEDFIRNPINNSKGCGGVMRVAPLGLIPLNRAAWEAAQVAAFTHGHPLGYMSASVLAQLIHGIVRDCLDLKGALNGALDEVVSLFAGNRYLGELLQIVSRAVELTGNDRPDRDNIRELGEGWVAEEALAISLYCALRHVDSFSDGIIAAVNHGGDSDSTGAITGNILGALVGYGAISGKWKRNLELAEVIREISDDLDHGCVLIDDYSCGEEWEEKYVHCSRRSFPQFVYDGDSQIWLKNDRSRKLRCIRYTFQPCFLKIPDEHEPDTKTVTKIFPDGIVEIIEYSGRRKTSVVRKRVSFKEIKELIDRINACDDYNTWYCDAMSYVSYVFEDGKFRHYNSSPACLEEFVNRLDYNSHYVIRIDD